MYNYTADSVPELLPVSVEVHLNPWFPREVLDAGLDLIRDGRITVFHVLRNGVGGCVDDEATVTLLFEESKRLSQGFVLRSNYCGLCGHEAQKKRCPHMAALAILGMVVPAGERNPKPVPFAFLTSHWRKTGKFLCEWLGQKKYDVLCDGQGTCERWQVTAEGCTLDMWLPSFGQASAGYLLPGVCGKDGNVLSGLFEELKLLSMTSSERQLEAAGSVGRAWRRESSFWNWLAVMLFLCHGDDVPELVLDSAISGFVLAGGEPGEPGAYRFELPREKAWLAVKEIPFPEDVVKVLPKARECYKVFFNTENQVVVRPSLRLADGTVRERQKMEGLHLDGAWYLPVEGFLPFSRVSGEGQFSNPAQQKSSLSLFDFLRSEEAREDSFTVGPGELQSFLDENRKPLEYPDNEVDPALRDLEFCDFPDRLVIKRFTTEDDFSLVSCRYGIGNGEVTLADIRTAVKEGMAYLPGKKWLRLAGTPLSWFHDLLGERAEAGGGLIRLSSMELFRLVGVMPEVEVMVKETGSRARLDEMLDIDSWTNANMLIGVPDHLRSYQANGLAWLARLVRFGVGGLLADDMGLGKTHQGLALLQMVLRNDRQAKTMVVCPASVVLHWVEKIKCFYPGLDYHVYYGPDRDPEKIGKHRISITTYGVVRRDVELLSECRFDLVLLDEIQNVKNSKTAVHSAVAGLQSRVSIGLTGTPVENSLQDLHSLFAVCLPGFLGSEKQFADHYRRPITEQNRSEVGKRLSQLIAPFILRRTRGQVLSELPDVIEAERYCELSVDQVDLYQEVLSNGGEQLSMLGDETKAIPYMHILATLTRLKQLCCHPCLLDKSLDLDSYQCGKWDLFLELSGELLESEMKFVVFSQYLGMLDLMENHFRTMGVGVAGLRGNMSVGNRKKMIDRFNNDPGCRVFCASLLAGGVGIDLTGARAVIHYDRWWNPAKEEQATARVHRMGQKNVVQVFRLITVDTLEEKIHHLLQEKQKLSESVILEDEAGVIKQLDREQLAWLLEGSRGLKS